MIRSSKWSLPFTYFNHVSYMCCSLHSSWYDHPNSLQVMKLHIMQSSPPPAISSHIRPNILLITLFSDTANLCSSLRIRDQVSHPYKQQAKLWFIYFKLLFFLERRREAKTLNKMVANIPRT
jgi:hypothetical protein